MTPPLELILFTYSTIVTAGWIARECNQTSVGEGGFWAFLWFLILAAFHLGLFALIAAAISTWLIVFRSFGELVTW